MEPQPDAVYVKQCVNSEKDDQVPRVRERFNGAPKSTKFSTRRPR